MAFDSSVLTEEIRSHEQRFLDDPKFVLDSVDSPEGDAESAEADLVAMAYSFQGEVQELRTEATGCAERAAAAAAQLDAAVRDYAAWQQRLLDEENEDPNRRERIETNVANVETLLNDLAASPLQWPDELEDPNFTDVFDFHLRRAAEHRMEGNDYVEMMLENVGRLRETLGRMETLRLTLRDRARELALEPPDGH